MIEKPEIIPLFLLKKIPSRFYVMLELLTMLPILQTHVKGPPQKGSEPPSLPFNFELLHGQSLEEG